MKPFEIDIDMAGDIATTRGYQMADDPGPFCDEFLRQLCRYLTKHGYPCEPVFDGSARRNPNAIEPPEDLWVRALSVAVDEAEKMIYGHSLGD